MILDAPDPCPGRCRNFHWTEGQSHVEMLRCLDYEGTSHICHFPEPTPEPSLSQGIYTTKPAEPWVKP